LIAFVLPSDVLGFSWGTKSLIWIMFVIFHLVVENPGAIGSG